MTTERQRRTSSSHTVLACDGYDFYHDILLACRDFTEYSRKILTDPFYSFTGAAERESVRGFSENMCFSGLDYGTELNRSRKV